MKFTSSYQGRNSIVEKRTEVSRQGGCRRKESSRKCPARGTIESEHLVTWWKAVRRGMITIHGKNKNGLAVGSPTYRHWEMRDEKEER